MREGQIRFSARIARGERFGSCQNRAVFIIYGKLDVHSRTQAVARARELALV